MRLGVYDTLGVYGEGAQASSQLNLVMQNIPDGSHTTRVFDMNAQGVVLHSGPLTWASGAASLTVQVTSGTELEYYAIAATQGGVNRGTAV